MLQHYSLRADALYGEFSVAPDYNSISSGLTYSLGDAGNFRRIETRLLALRHLVTSDGYRLRGQIGSSSRYAARPLQLTLQGRRGCCRTRRRYRRRCTPDARRKHRARRIGRALDSARVPACHRRCRGSRSGKFFALLPQGSYGRSETVSEHVMSLVRAVMPIIDRRVMLGIFV